MNDTESESVADAPAEVAVPAKAKRGRPKKLEGVKAARKAKRDIYYEAFGDKRARVAVAALKRGPDGKSIIAAVKLFTSSSKKRSRLEAVRAKLVARNDAIIKKVAEVDEKLVKFVNADEAVKGFHGRVFSMIETIYGNPEPKPVTA